MKRLSVFITVKEIVILTIFFSLLVDFIFYLIFFGPDLSGNEYGIRRLSSESNPRGNGEDYLYVYYGSYGITVIRYSFATGEETEYHVEVPEGIRYYGSVIAGDQVYYWLSDDSVRRFDWEKQTDEEIFSGEDILGMYGREEWEKLPTSAYISLSRYGECLVLSLDEHGKKYIYVCPVDGDLKTDIVDVNALFPKEDRTGRKQTIEYRGMRIKRYYDMENERYVIGSLKDAEQLVTLYCEGWPSDDFYYSVEGSPVEHKIECLNEYAEIQKSKLTTENGKIIGLLHVPKNIRLDPFEPSQKELKHDVLFSLDPETGESSIMYKARNNRARIIGYQDGVIYLLHNYRIYTKKVDGGKIELFMKLPRDSGYMFDWQGDYLIVMLHGNMFGAYKVR